MPAKPRNGSMSALPSGERVPYQPPGTLRGRLGVPAAYHTTNASPDRRRLVMGEMTQDAF
jgi:hypothetical protein